MKTVSRALLVFGALALTAITTLSLTSCAYPVRNQPIATLAPNQGYRWANLPAGRLGDTLVFVTASGGGTRAAALELSVLEGLQQIKLPSGDSLADNIDVLSSVSGGSVTAAYFALKGTEGFPELETNFIRKDGVSAILLAGLNPVGLAKLSTPKYERIDLLIDYLDKALFHHQTFSDLLALHRRPYLVLNAADMVDGVPFAETQENFDLLCSDLASLKLSTAVAASAAFPVALSPVTYKDYSPCLAQAKVPWPPPWVTADAGSSWYDAPERTDRGRVKTAYALGARAAPPTLDVHLLDGGIADNLGVAEPFRMLTTNEPQPAFLNSVAQGHIKKIVFILINARSFASSTLDQSPAPPGMLDMLFASIDAGVDRTTFGTAARLRTALTEQFTADAANLRKIRQGAMADNLDAIRNNTHLIEIDFDAIANSACRRNFHNIPTSWTAQAKQIDALMLLGKALLAQSPEFPLALNAIKGHVAGSLPNVTDACAIVPPS